MNKFNARLSQLEAIHSVAPPVKKTENSLNISDFIYHIFENQSLYNLDGISKSWFIESDKVKSFKFLNNILESKGKLIKKKCILEGIELFKKYES